MASCYPRFPAYWIPPTSSGSREDLVAGEGSAIQSRLTAQPGGRGLWPSFHSGTPSFSSAVPPSSPYEVPPSTLRIFSWAGGQGMVVTSLSLSIGGDPSVGKGREAGWAWAWTRWFCHFLAQDLLFWVGFLSV